MVVPPSSGGRGALFDPHSRGLDFFEACGCDVYVVIFLEASLWRDIIWMMCGFHVFWDGGCRGNSPGDGCELRQRPQAEVQLQLHVAGLRIDTALGCDLERWGW